MPTEVMDLEDLVVGGVLVILMMEYQMQLLIILEAEELELLVDRHLVVIMPLQEMLGKHPEEEEGQEGQDQEEMVG